MEKEAGTQYLIFWYISPTLTDRAGVILDPSSPTQSTDMRKEKATPLKRSPERLRERGGCMRHGQRLEKLFHLQEGKKEN